MAGGMAAGLTRGERRDLDDAVMLDVSLTPDPSKLPFSGTLQELANGLLAVVLVLIAVAGFLSAGTWALGIATSNMSWAERGKSGFIVAVIAATLSGAAAILVNFFFHLGQALH